MTSLAEPGVEAMLREMLERQRRCDSRLEALESTLTSLNEPKYSPSSSDTVAIAHLKTPSMIGWPRRELPALVTPVMKTTRSGGVIQTPAPRRAEPSPPPEPAQVSIRPSAPASFEAAAPEFDRTSQLEVLLAESELRRRSGESRLARLEEQVAEQTNQLRQSRRLETIGRLVAGVAHDFNNLLTLICGNAELIRDGLPENDHNREAALQVISAGQSAAGLTRQLLAIARPAAGEPRPLDLNEVVHNAEKMIRRLVGEGLSLTVNLAPSIELVRGDPVQVEQVLFNLAANARDAIGGGSGSVVIRTSDAVIEPGRAGWPEDLPPGAYVALTVSDTGCGMSEDVKARLFEPFFTTKAGDKGNGLGLANVRDTMRQAGGHVEVESAVGWGTSIRLYWPRLMTYFEEDQDEALVPLVPQTIGRGQTVLLVEDDLAVRDLASVSLQQAGYRVLEAPDADTAEERVRLFAGPVSLLIADVGLPGRDGVQLAARMRASRPGLRVLYVSGYGAPRPLPSGADGEFLPKPYTPQQFLDTVRRLVGQDRQE